jgi:hypothetical protein
MSKCLEKYILYGSVNKHAFQETSDKNKNIYLKTAEYYIITID